MVDFSPEPGPMDLLQVVRQAPEEPLSSDLSPPSEEELPEPLPLLQLTEHRFDDRLPSSVVGPASAPPDFPTLRLGERLPLRRPTPSAAFPLFLLPSSRRAEHLRPAALHGADPRLAEVARIGEQHLRSSAQLRLDPVEHRHEMSLIRGHRHHLGPDDDLMRLVHRRLTVVSLEERPLVRSVRHDP